MQSFLQPIWFSHLKNFKNNFQFSCMYLVYIPSQSGIYNKRFTFKIELVLFRIWLKPEMKVPFERSWINAKTEGYASFWDSVRSWSTCRKIEANEIDIESVISSTWPSEGSERSTANWKRAWGSSKKKQCDTHIIVERINLITLSCGIKYPLSKSSWVFYFAT